MLREQLVLDDAGLHGQEERVRKSRGAVQEIEDGVAPLRLARIAGRQVHDHLLAAPSHRRAADGDRLRRPAVLHPRGIAWGRVAAVEPKVVEVAIDADEPDTQRRGGGGERGGPAQRAAPARGARAGYTSCAGRSSDSEPAVRLSPGIRRGHERAPCLRVVQVKQIIGRANRSVSLVFG